MSTSTHAASRGIQSDNFKALTARKLSEAEQRVLHAVRLGHARGQSDLSLTEICLLMEEQLGRRVSSNQISGRVTSLVAGGHLARAARRPCSVTKAPQQPVYAVAKQASLSI